jgi:hypothetical protein
VGLVNCFEGFSTFACRPLVNVHDLVVAASHRGRRVGEQMLAAVEHIACARGACKPVMGTRASFRRRWNEAVRGSAPGCSASTKIRIKRALSQRIWVKVCYLI